MGIVPYNVMGYVNLSMYDLLNDVGFLRFFGDAEPYNVMGYVNLSMDDLLHDICISAYS